ncbi:MAG: hypothetical protein ACM37U_04785 [Gemmatimonas sp.]|nr:hypothetical protein [Gemmatimonadaceae bacterium]
MRHTIRLQSVIVGYSELENIEPDLGRAWGAFRPGLGYELVQPVFRLFAQAVPREGSAKNTEMLERYYSARDALDLHLEDSGGRVIRTSAIHIADYTVEEGSAALQLDVLISEETYWAQRVGA